MKKLKEEIARRTKVVSKRIIWKPGEWHDAIKARSLKDAHTALKKIYQRGTETPSHRAALHYLQSLEAEMKQINAALDEAWLWVDSRNFRQCSRHADKAQQRLHKVIKKLGKRK